MVENPGLSVTCSDSVTRRMLPTVSKSTVPTRSTVSSPSTSRDIVTYPATRSPVTDPSTETTATDPTPSTQTPITDPPKKDILPSPPSVYYELKSLMYGLVGAVGVIFILVFVACAVGLYFCYHRKRGNDVRQPIVPHEANNRASACSSAVSRIETRRDKHQDTNILKSTKAQSSEQEANDSYHELDESRMYAIPRDNWPVTHVTGNDPVYVNDATDVDPGHGEYLITVRP